jgi:hypothetical protein
MAMGTQWYIVREGERRGPYSGAELQDLADDGKLHPRDMVWCEGMPDWVPAKNVLDVPAASRSNRRQRDRDDLEEGADETRPSSQFPGRLVTPGFFCFSFLMFFLPWVDVRCNGMTALSQSGFQACIGDYSESILMAERRQGNQPGFRMKGDKVRPAPLLWIYGLLIAFGMIGGIALSVGVPRLISLFLCGFVGFVLLMIQLMVGFPITEQVKKANADPNLRREIENNQMFPFAQVPPFPLPGAGGRDLVWVNMTPWFWIGALSTFGAIGGLALEHAVIFATGKKRHRAQRSFRS